MASKDLRDEGHYAPSLLSKFKEIWGPDFVPPFDVAPEGWEAIFKVNQGVGDVFSRDILDLKTKVIIITSVLLALGVKPYAKLYLQGLRKMGYSDREVAEAIVTAGIFSGVPRAIDGFILLQELKDEDEERAKAKGFFYRPPKTS